MKQLLLLCVLTASSAAQTTATASFWAVTAGNAAATSFDAYTTIYKVGHTATCPYEEWSPALYGRRPEAPRTIAVMGGLFAASVLVSYGLKRRHAHIWKVPLWAAPQAYLAYGHALGAVHNFRFCH